MSSKKNIDRLFQERFKDFEAAPPMAAWDNIEKELDSKKPVAVIPLWLKWIGIAAGIALLATLAYTGLTNSADSNNNNNQIVIESNKADTDNSPIKSSSIEKEVLENEFVSEDNLETNLPNSTNDEDDSNINNSVATEKVTSAESNNALASQNANSTQQKALAGVNNITTNSNNNSANLTGTDNKANDYASNRASSNPVTKGIPEPKKVPQTDFALNQSSTNKTNQNEQLNSSSSPTRKNNNLKKTPQFETPQSSNTEVTAVQKQNDSTKTPQPSLEDYAAQQQDEDDENSDALPFKKWNASSILAPVYSSTLGGSSINEQFVDNQKSAGLNLSYGVNVGYHLSERLSVRTGVHRVNVSYTTNDIIYGNPSPGDIQLLSIDNYNPSAVSSSNAVASGNLGSSFSQEFLSDNTFNGFQGEISQRLGYLEVPLEVKYKLFDSKFSVNVMGGMSALFLTDNSIAVSNGSAKLELGEDSNFNSFNQSANFGLGIDYLFTDQLGITVEPIFKYQLNTLRENTAGFRPFNVGVYSGITYKF